MALHKEELLAYKRDSKLVNNYNQHGLDKKESMVSSSNINFLFRTKLFTSDTYYDSNQKFQKSIEYMNTARVAQNEFMMETSRKSRDSECTTRSVLSSPAQIQWKSHRQRGSSVVRPTTKSSRIPSAEPDECREAEVAATHGLWSKNNFSCQTSQGEVALPQIPLLKLTKN